MSHTRATDPGGPGNWPASGLEHLGACPACGSRGRALLHARLEDWTFRCAPGTWTMWCCAACASAYLDPRPTPATIAQAYAAYYTHAAAPAPTEYRGLGAWRRLRRRLANGYASRRYGLVAAEPASSVGPLLAFVLPGLRAHVDHRFRHLPPARGAKRAVLDVGCGNGSFLSVAAACGWEAVGVDADARAVEAGQGRGRAVVHGGIEALAGSPARFDAITLSHFIEHVHDPASVLRACHALLKPDGRLWLETPNIDSYSHLRFGPCWRGLEAPRHLVLFSLRSLRQQLAAAGFVSIRDARRPDAFDSLYRSSDAIRCAVEGSSPTAGFVLRLEAAAASIKAKFAPHRREHLTLVARKGLAEHGALPLAS